MRATILEYLRTVVRTWWARVSLLAGAVGLASELTNLVIPSVVWWTVVAVAVVLAQFTAFHHVRAEREELRAQIEASQVEPEVPTFSPSLFEGRLFPNTNYSVLDGGIEWAFVIRAALAFAIDADYEQLTSETLKLFEDTVAGSALEGWMQRQMDTMSTVPDDQWWERVQPTRSQIVTVARPPARLPHYDFTLAGHCVINFNPGMGPWHSGYGELVASAIFRPAESEAENMKGHPLSFDDLYAAITFLEASLVDQIAPPLVAKVTGSELRPQSFAVLAIANGGTVADHVGIKRNHWTRAAGSYDSGALWGRAASETTLVDPLERDREIKSWLVRFLRDEGYSDFEADVERLQTPKLPQPLTT